MVWLFGVLSVNLSRELFLVSILLLLVEEISHAQGVIYYLLVLVFSLPPNKLGRCINILSDASSYFTVLLYSRYYSCISMQDYGAPCKSKNKKKKEGSRVRSPQACNFPVASTEHTILKVL